MKAIGTNCRLPVGSRGSGGASATTSIHKAFRLLEFLAARSQPASLAEASHACGLPKPSAFRLFKVLHSLGYVERFAEMRRYGLGAHAARLAGADPYAALKQHARPVLENLHAQLDETVNLAVLCHQRIVYVDCLETSRPLRMIVAPGSWEPWYLTAIGRAAAAFLPAEAQEELLASSDFRQPAADGGKLSAPILARALRRFRRQGWAEEIEAAVLGVGCLAVPLASLGFPLAAISVAVPLRRLTPKRRREITALLHRSMKPFRAQRPRT